MTDYEWATVNPENGAPIRWDTEERARQAHAMSATFDGGQHPLVCREVGPWLPAGHVGVAPQTKAGRIEKED